ncbi:uncharacterized protein MELLADRAFT_92105 [Melampsora larici-populina 98AG31]|uniref:F-box domain-containing protein n=1 Tax=Melampsora larici-populina (strain 98AG31 / pathotype 3-4-7) TaxID=747676 RepID=F4S1I6_MELLP|nr:uncharacterized protein MELLADRAFT_92105 [Melampsora larici-populina 98AG31]EGG01498.1 hypothetical protein MELLADRAFT_92105 [Melampsora larici-populina 98AG31]
MRFPCEYTFTTGYTGEFRNLVVQDNPIFCCSLSCLPLQSSELPMSTKQKSNHINQTQMSNSSKANIPKDLFGQLPDETILEIVGYILNDWTHYKGNHHQKNKQIITLVSEDTEPLHLYEHKPEAPIMTSFQSFSVCNRRIHQICQPVLWQCLAIDGEIPRPMSFWNQEILPKYACYVKEFYADLRGEWIREPHSPVSIRQTVREGNQHHLTLRSSDLNKFKFLKSIGDRPRTFNTHGALLAEAVDFHKLAPNVQRSLLEVKQDVVLNKSPVPSPEELLKVLAQCNNLTSICFKFPGHWLSFSTRKASNLSCNLTSLFSNLQHLQRLQYLAYTAPPYSSIPAESIIEPIKHLPLLRSLELANISVKHWGRTDCLASSLHDLKNLKVLALIYVDVIDDSWARHEAPPQLVKLVLYHYLNMWSSNLPLYISSWAPHLIDLELKLEERHYSEQDEVPPDFDPTIHRFSLPALTHLTIYRNFACETFQCFTDCPNLLHLTVRDPSEDGLSEFIDFIISDVFPNLKKLVMPMKYRNLPPNPTLDSILIPLEDFCKFKGIEFDVIQDFVSRPFSPTYF